MSILNPSVGSITTLTMQGRVSTLQQSMEEISRRGVDGVAFVKVGKRAPASVVTTETDVANSSAIASHVNACVALVGTLVTVTQPDGTTVPNVLILGVEFVTSKYFSRPVGGVAAGNYIVTMRWHLQATQ